MTQRGAVVCSSGHGVNGLGVVRSLGRRGRRVTVVYDSPGNLAAQSSYCVHSICIDSTKPDELGSTLLGLGEQAKERPVLYFDNDRMMLSLSNHANQLEALFILSSPIRGIEVLSDKFYQMKMAEESGIPVPRTWYPEDWNDIELIGKSTAAQLIAKPSPTFYTNAHPFKVILGKNAPDLIRELRRCVQSPKGTIVQEFIEGPDTNVWFALCFCRTGGVPTHRIVTGHKIRQTGSGAGGVMASGVLCDSEAVRQLTCALAARLGYTGIFGVEYKYCPQDDKYYFIEISARTERFHTISCSAGVDLPWIAYTQLTGLLEEPLKRNSFEPEAYWIDAASDLRVFFRMARQGYVFSFFKPYFRRKRWAILESDDLRPWKAATLQLLKESMRSASRKIGWAR